MRDGVQSNLDAPSLEKMTESEMVENLCGCLGDGASCRANSRVVETDLFNRAVSSGPCKQYPGRKGKKKA